MANKKHPAYKQKNGVENKIPTPHIKPFFMPEIYNGNLSTCLAE